MEVGATCLLVDEDTCATNFMIRDEKMRRLVANEKEPITPFVIKIRPLFQDYSVSSILVIGGSGDYFSVADRVLMMDNYRCVDVTDRAHAISPPSTTTSSQLAFGSLTHRRPVPRSFQPDGKVRIRTKTLIDYGDQELDLAGLEQLGGTAQTNAVAAALQRIPDLFGTAPPPTLRQAGRRLDETMDRLGLDETLAPGQYHGNLARPRVFEIAGAMNRLRTGDSDITTFVIPNKE
jgi:predicted ABC-class ATPase